VRVSVSVTSDELLRRSRLRFRGGDMVTEERIVQRHRESPAFRESFGERLLREQVLAEELFYELAGPCARPVDRDGVLWERACRFDGWVAVADIPSPEGLLL
jgi:hypothetical protein